MPDYAAVIQFYEGLLQAVSSKTTVSNTRQYSIAGSNFIIHFIGIRYLPFFTLSIAHLETTEITGDFFTLYVVDASVADIQLPPLFWRPEDVADYDGAIGKMPPGLFAACITEYQIIQFLHHTAKTGFYWMNNAAILQEWESSFPFRSLFYQVFKQKGFLFIHAGAVGSLQGGILLTGKGGTGKSTACLSAILYSKLQYAGDDFICIHPQQMIAFSLYNIAKLTEANITRFPALANGTDGLDGDKLQYFVHKKMPGKMVKQFSVKAIFLPNFNTAHTTVTLTAASRQDAMKALVPSSVWLVRAGDADIHQLGLLISRMPCYWLNTNENLSEIASVIENYIHENA